MAFSTQKDFLHIAFMNQRPKEECPRQTGVHLKSYASATDNRSWSLSKDEQTNFLADTVACRIYKNDECGTGGRAGYEAGYVDATSAKSAYSKTASLAQSSARTMQFENDSLIHVARLKLEEIADIFEENKQLQKQLELSEDHLKIVNDENQKIKTIMSKGFDPRKVNPFQKKVQSLRQAGRIDAKDEKELLEMHKLMGRHEKAYDILEAENATLRRLCEKLGNRVKYDNISFEPVSSSDIKYLQNEVNNLRKETAILRAMEDDKISKKINYETALRKANKANKDAHKLKEISDERNKLREKLEMMIGIEERIAALKKRAMEANRLETELSNLKSTMKSGGGIGQGDTIQATESHREFASMTKTEIDAGKRENDKLRYRIGFMEKEYAETEKQLRNCRTALKAQNQELQDKLNRICCFQEELCCVKSQLHRKDCTIRDYESQLYQLMDVIEELSGQCAPQIQNLQDANTQTKDGHLADLAWATEATLEQIGKGLQIRSSLEKELEETSKVLESVRQASEDEISGMLLTLESSKSENIQLKKSMEKAVAEVDKSLAEVIGPKIVEVADEDCCSKLQLLRNEVAALKDTYDMEKKDLLRKLSDNENLINGLKSACDKEKSNLMGKLSEKESLLNDLQEAFEKEKSVLLDKLKDHDKLLLDNDKLTGRLASEMNNVAEAKRKSSTLEDQQKAMAEELKGKEAAGKKSVEKADALEVENANLSKEKDKLANDLADKQKETLDLLKRLKELEGELEKTRAQAADLEKRLIISEDQFKECKNLISEIESEQHRNQQLKTVVDAADDADKLRKLISDLEQRLEMEKKRVGQLLEENKVCKDQVKNLKNIVTESEAMKRFTAADNATPNVSAKNVVTESEKMKRSTAADNSTPNVSAKNVVIESEAMKRSSAADNEIPNVSAKKSPVAAASAARGALSGRNTFNKKDVPVVVKKSSSVKVVTDINNPQETFRAGASRSTKPTSVQRTQNQNAKAPEREASSPQPNPILRKPNCGDSRKTTSDLRSVCSSPQRWRVCEQSSSTDLEETIKDLLDNICTTCGSVCRKKTKKLFTRLDEICQKVLNSGIKYLNLKELIYLHREVYEAGLRIHPDCIHEIADDTRFKCCKCRGFSCCLPSVPKDIEKKLIAKTIFLESQLDEMRKCFQWLKKHYKLEIKSTHFQAKCNEKLNQYPKSSNAENNEVDKIFQHISTMGLPGRSKPETSFGGLNRITNRNEPIDFELPTRDRQ